MTTTTTSGGSSAATTTTRRLKREEFQRTKHDSAFSSWKILVGASDWNDHATGKEGAEKYRTQNLPNSVSCPGVYELAISKIKSSARNSRKLDLDSVITVYVGQAENVRTRLQQYGRDGAHLENGCSHGESTNCKKESSNKAPGLFSEIFARGRDIVYRFAPMKSKQDAEITETQLLDKFDYPWNKDKNGVRRKEDVFKALDRKASLFSVLAKKFLFSHHSHQKQVGIKIRSCEPLRSKNGSSFPNSDNNFSFSKILKINRLQPVPVQHGYADDCSDICGVAIGQGSICTKSPVKGRKRCAAHKGMRVNGYISKIDTENKTPSVHASIRSGIVSDPHSHQIPCTTEHSTNKSSASICGVITSHGSICTTPSVKGRKRCAAHKGMRVNGYISKSNTVGKELPIPASLGSGIIAEA